MKKTVTLVAGLLLVSGTIFGAEVKLKHTMFESTYNAYDSISGPLSNFQKKPWDATFRVKLEAEAKLGNFGTVTGIADFTKAKEDREISIQYNRKFGDFEVGTGAYILKNNNYDFNNNGNYSDNERVIEASLDPKMDKNTYFKWKVMGSNALSLTYYPWQTPMSWEDWDTMETFIHKNPGMVLDVNAIKDTTLTVKVATLNEDDYSKENYYAINTSVKTKVAGANISAYGAFTTEDSNNKEIAYGVMADKSLTKKIAVKASFNSSKDGKNDAKMGAFGKVSYSMNSYKNYSPTAYVQGLWKNEAAAAEFTDATNDGREWIDGVTDGNLYRVETGVKLQQGNFSLTPRVTYETRDKNHYVEYKGTKSKATSKSYSTVGVTFSHEVWN